MASPDQKLHIAMFPWLAFGHMIPYLELSKLIAQKGHKISFISTPRNIDRLPKPPQDITSLITFVKLPLPRLDRNLPDSAEATTDLPFDKVPLLKKAYDGLEPSLVQFLQASQPDWLFYDFVPFWLPPLATKLRIRHGFFSIYIAAALSFIGQSLCPDYRRNPEDYTVQPNWVPFPSPVAYRLYEVLKIFQGVSGDETNMSDFVRYVELVKTSDVIIIRSCVEFEPEYLQLVESLHRKPVIPVGQLIPLTNPDTGDENEAWKSMKLWLDKQVKGSVVYVAFGSEAKPSQDELNEIALGLEMSNLPFFWVLRTRLGQYDTDIIRLPDGFEDRTEGRGLVCTSWAPQLKILGHDSIGGFLTHSGWTSVVEAVHFERPLILLTFLADQGLNARLLEEKKIGYSIPRDERDGSFTRNLVAKSVRLVVVEERGKIYREKVKETKRLFGGRERQERYLDDFLEYLMSHKRVA